jgi:hypothetical protein
MRIAALVLILLVTPAAAEPNYSRQLHDWLWPQKPVASPTVPVVVSPLPELPLTPFVEPVKAPESAWPEPPKVHPRTVERVPTGRPKPARKSAIRPRNAASPGTPGITCAQARQGVGMPCFLIRANAYQYERLSRADKAKADSCLSAAERAVIVACFR